MSEVRAILDANEATARVAYKLSELVAIYPITPSSPMAEHCDAWSTEHQPNLFGQVPRVVQMQSEGGAAGALHGALMAGTLATSFTASQGLLLYIPNLYKIAGELLPFVLHVSARTVATHALSIYGDHSDVMACRQTGMAMLCSNTPQEAQDLALIAHAATLNCRVPVMHFFDGFRTSHELNVVHQVTDTTIEAMIDADALRAFRARGLSPDAPTLRGTAHNPDTWFQAREAINPYYDHAVECMEQAMLKFESLTGRSYKPFDYEGHPEATEVVICMGSGCETLAETALALNALGRKVGVLKVRLFRPFSADLLLKALPQTVRSIAVLDRTKEPGALGEPLYMDVATALFEDDKYFVVKPTLIGGRYGLSSKEFTPAMAQAIYGELQCVKPKKRFTVGIVDDVTGLSLEYAPDFDITHQDTTTAVFFGLGADGTVGANKNTIHILGDQVGLEAQGYFYYDSRKSGSLTTSHLRFGKTPIRQPYLVSSADFVGCHQGSFVGRYEEILRTLKPGGTLLLNTPWEPSEVWSKLPLEWREALVAKSANFYVVDAYKIARECGLKGRINGVMQTCYFALSGILPLEEAKELIRSAIRETYGSKGEKIIAANMLAVDAAVSAMAEIPVIDLGEGAERTHYALPEEAPDFVQKVTAAMLRGEGELLPVSAFPADGVWPTATAKWEKRNIAEEIPAWDPDLCIQCNKCAFVCPHSAVRVSYYPEENLSSKPSAFQSMPFRNKDLPGHAYTVQVAPEDCTGCTLCAVVCPTDRKTGRKALEMKPQELLRAQEKENFAFFEALPKPSRTALRMDVKGSQFLEPLFEYSGACAGCGETPYIKLLSQLFGDRLLVANATGCSSIYGGNLPTTPWTQNEDGRGPAWANSLFEDNAEFGLGLHLSSVQKHERAKMLLESTREFLPAELVNELLSNPQVEEADTLRQRDLISQLQGLLDPKRDAELLRISGDLCAKTTWILGGDGWAYDIGFGGLDHVIASGERVRILIMDTEVYSNTGGQQSKATPIGAIARFAEGGKQQLKKDLGQIAMTYGNVYVAQIAYGAKDLQTLQALKEAESFPGPAVIIAYSPCISHGYGMQTQLEQQKRAVDTGYWPLYRFDPRRLAAGEAALKLDSPAPKMDLADFLFAEGRFRELRKDTAQTEALLSHARTYLGERYALLQRQAALVPEIPSPESTDQ